MEHECLLTGIGGQGVQLAAQVIARGATIERQHVLLFGVYAGAMRGMNTDATVVIGDAPLVSPPIVSSAASAIALHDRYFGSVAARLRPGAFVVVNEATFDGAVPTDAQIVLVDGSGIARDLGNELVASMVLTGAWGAQTDLVSLDGLIAGMRASVPAYRSQHIEMNAAALRAGFELVGASA